VYQRHWYPHVEQLSWHLQQPLIDESNPISQPVATYQNERVGSVVPMKLAQRQLAIADYRNKTYFRIKKTLRKLKPAVLIREERNVYDKKVAKGDI